MGKDAAAGIDLSVEAALLVACTRARLDPDSAIRVRDLAGAVREWPTLLEMGRRHRLVPLLYTHLSAAAEDLVPDTLLASLREDFAANAATNLALAVELVAILELLEYHGVRALAYKGPTFAQCIYGSLAARQMKDIDILVNTADADHVTSLLAGREYYPVTRMLPAARRLGLEYQCVFTRSDATIVEVHWSVVPRAVAPPVTLEDLWPNRLLTGLLGRTLSSPSHEDMLVILCIHGSKHHWARLGWICCVAELLRSKPLDWMKVLARAEQWHAKRMLMTGMVLAVRLLDAPMPDVAGLTSSVPDVEPLVATVMGRLFLDDDLIDGRSLRAFQLATQEGVRDKARYLWFRPLIDGARQGARVVDWLQEMRTR